MGNWLGPVPDGCPEPIVPSSYGSKGGKGGYYGGKGGKGGYGFYEEVGSYGGKGGKGGKAGYYNWMGPAPPVDNPNLTITTTVVASGYYGGKGGKGSKGGYYVGDDDDDSYYGAKGGKGGKGGKGSKGGFGAALVFAYVEDALEPAYEKAPKPISYGKTSSTRSVDNVKQMFENYKGLDADEAENDVPWADVPPTPEANFEIASSSIFSEEQQSSVQGFSSSISAAVPSSISNFLSCVKITAVVGALVFALL